MSIWSEALGGGRRQFMGTADAGDLHIVSEGELPESAISINLMCKGEQVFFAACARRDIQLSSQANTLRLSIGSCLIGLDNDTTRGACIFLGIALPPGDPGHGKHKPHTEHGAPRASLSPLDPPASATPPPEPIPLAGGSNPSLELERHGMSEMQIDDHPVLRACNHGHTPHMYEAKGNLRIAYYVECSPCVIRTAKVSSPERAAIEWNTRATMPILFTAAA